MPIAGLIMVPAPGPGWLVVFFGLLILASEFEFAQRWLDFARRHVSRWNDWIMAQALWVRGLVALGTLLIVWGVDLGLPRVGRASRGSCPSGPSSC